MLAVNGVPAGDGASAGDVGRRTFVPDKIVTTVTDAAAEVEGEVGAMIAVFFVAVMIDAAEVAADGGHFLVRESVHFHKRKGGDHILEKGKKNAGPKNLKLLHRKCRLLHRRHHHHLSLLALTAK